MRGVMDIIEVGGNKNMVRFESVWEEQYETKAMSVL